MANAITGGNDIGLWTLWPANVLEKSGNISWSMKKLLFDIAMKSHFFLQRMISYLAVVVDTLWLKSTFVRYSKNLYWYRFFRVF